MGLISRVSSRTYRQIKFALAPKKTLYINTMDDSGFGARRDAFAEATANNTDVGQLDVIHIRIQQRNGRKTLTTVQGIDPKFDLKKIVRACKQKFACNGTVVEHKEHGEVLQFQGDQRQHTDKFLTEIKLTTEENIKV